jgi:hypothetical protein
MILIEDSFLYDKIYWIDKKYRCSHCGIGVSNYNIMTKHESQCEYNPKNRNCSTCDSHCVKQPTYGIGCRRWKNVKFERIKKLTLLKNKIKMHGDN